MESNFSFICFFSLDFLPFKFNNNERLWWRLCTPQETIVAWNYKLVEMKPRWLTSIAYAWGSVLADVFLITNRNPNFLMIAYSFYWTYISLISIIMRAYDKVKHVARDHCCTKLQIGRDETKMADQTIIIPSTVRIS